MDPAHLITVTLGSFFPRFLFFHSEKTVNLSKNQFLLVFKLSFGSFSKNTRKLEMSNLDEIKKLHELKESGAISNAEFEKMKNSIINKNQGSFADQIDQATKNIKENDWAMIIHLSQFAGYFVPFFGFAVPIIIWFLKKEESQTLNRHGRIVINWMLSELLYTLLCIPFIFILIGYPALLLVLFLGVLYPIIGAIKAKEGIVWSYPLSIPFLKTYDDQWIENA